MDNFKALIAEFKDFCERYNRCAECPLYEYETASECIGRFIFDKLTMNKTEPVTPAVEDKEEVSRLPKWCKEGQWVMTEDGKILKIDCITGDLVSVRIPNDLAYCTSTPDLTFKPVRFREYSFEEAKGLLGKVMDYSCDNGPFSGRSEKSTLITNVSNGKYGVLINGDFFRDLSERFNATINGIPIGVPVIDEEALKEVADGEHEL